MHKSNKFFIGAIVGSTIAALTTLLFSTAEGRKIQKKLMHKFHQMNAKNGFMHHSIDQMKNKLMHKMLPKVKRKIHKLYRSRKAHKGHKGYRKAA